MKIAFVITDQSPDQLYHLQTSLHSDLTKFPACYGNVIHFAEEEHDCLDEFPTNNCSRALSTYIQHDSDIAEEQVPAPIELILKNTGLLDSISNDGEAMRF